MNWGLWSPAWRAFDPCLIRWSTDRIPGMAYVITSACGRQAQVLCRRMPRRLHLRGRAQHVHQSGGMRRLRRLPVAVRGRRDLPDDELPESELNFRADNAAFFTEVLPGRDAPIGTPGGASDLGPTGSTRRWSLHCPPGALVRRLGSANSVNAA